MELLLFKGTRTMSLKSKKTSFNHEWLLKDKFKWYVAPVEHDPYSVNYKSCQKNFALSNMGEKALTSHIEGKKHKIAVSASRSLSIRKKVLLKPLWNLMKWSVVLFSYLLGVQPQL